MAESERDDIEMPPEIPNNVFCYSLPDGTHVLGEYCDEEGNPLPCDENGNPIENG